MRIAAKGWAGGPTLALEASREHRTATFVGGYGHRWAIVSRFGRSTGVFPVYAIGEGDNDDDGICAAVEALVNVRDNPCRDRWGVPADWADQDYADALADGVLLEDWADDRHHIDIHNDVMLVRL